MNTQLNLLRKAVFLLAIALCYSNSVKAQYHEIEGRIVEATSEEPISYANIYNKQLGRGTIGNADGFFRIPIGDVTDSVQISFVGFNHQMIKLEEGTSFYLIYLEESNILLGQVTVTPKDESYLFALIQKCKQSASSVALGAKAYFDVKSFIDDSQIELVEGYYNVVLQGYQLADLHLKVGKIGLQPYENHFFASLESSRAILMQDLMNGNAYFPKNPFELSKSEMRKNYYMTLDYKYLDENADSILVIDYIPRDTTGLFFEGKIWINKSTHQLVKVTLNCPNARTHPFIPLFSTDSIANVSFAITQSFHALSRYQTVFKHTDFIYTMDYWSRVHSPDEQIYAVRTNVVLYAYDIASSFFQPVFNFSHKAINDYQKINALPYNTFFWANIDEYRLNDSLNTNEVFFRDTNTYTNITLFKPNEIHKKGIFQHPYVEWSEARVKFGEASADTSVNSHSGDLSMEDYNLAVKLYLDVNSYNDSTDIFTAAIFDPFVSYYKLPMDNQTHCFINIYFDLCEIERRALHQKLQGARDNMDQLMGIYRSFMKAFDIRKGRYFKEVRRGTNEIDMRKYNNFVVEHLGIDNIEIFKPFPTEE